MNILLTTLVFPYPVNDGGKSGTFRMIDALRKNNNITLICPETHPEHFQALKKLWPEVEILTFKSAPKQKEDSFFIDLAKKITGRKKEPTQSEVMKQQMLLVTCNLVDYYFEDLLVLFKKVVNNKKFDLVQIDFIELAPLVHFIPGDIPKVFVHHEIRFKRMERELTTLSDPDHSYNWKMANSKILELNLINLFDKIICLTETDRQILMDEGIAETKVETSPLPMILNKLTINQPYKSQNKLLFLGPDQHFPNLDGLDWFLKNCWSKLQKQKPGIELSVVGKWSEDKRKWFSQFSGVSFKGFVPDLATVMQGVVMIVPLRIGSGMRMKILEGVSYNVPIVTTSIGVEGLPLKNNMDCKIADQPDDFINAILEIIDNPDLQTRLIEKASQTLVNSFSTDDCSLTRESIYSSMLSSVK